MRQPMNWRSRAFMSWSWAATWTAVERRLPKYGQRVGKPILSRPIFATLRATRAVAKKAVALGGGHVDILINNAGIFPFGATHEMSVESFDEVYALNVKAPFFLVACGATVMSAPGTWRTSNRFKRMSALGGEAAPRHTILGAGKLSNEKPRDRPGGSRTSTANRSQM
jgi:NAD(P)-dependent dehydrogenase (short-subunit alcohol dehydrogenase family)